MAKGNKGSNSKNNNVEVVNFHVKRSFFPWLLCIISLICLFLIGMGYVLGWFTKPGPAKQKLTYLNEVYKLFDENADATEDCQAQITKDNYLETPNPYTGNRIIAENIAKYFKIPNYAILDNEISQKEYRANNDAMFYQYLFDNTGMLYAIINTFDNLDDKSDNAYTFYKNCTISYFLNIKRNNDNNNSSDYEFGFSIKNNKFSEKNNTFYKYDQYLLVNGCFFSDVIVSNNSECRSYIFYESGISTTNTTYYNKKAKKIMTSTESYPMYVTSSSRELIEFGTFSCANIGSTFVRISLATEDFAITDLITQEDINNTFDIDFNQICNDLKSNDISCYRGFDFLQKYLFVKDNNPLNIPTNDKSKIPYTYFLSSSSSTSCFDIQPNAGPTGYFNDLKQLIDEHPDQFMFGNYSTSYPPLLSSSYGMTDEQNDILRDDFKQNWDSDYKTQFEATNFLDGYNTNNEKYINVFNYYNCNKKEELFILARNGWTSTGFQYTDINNQQQFLNICNINAFYDFSITLTSGNTLAKISSLGLLNNWN